MLKSYSCQSIASFIKTSDGDAQQTEKTFIFFLSYEEEEKKPSISDEDGIHVQV